MKTCVCYSTVNKHILYFMSYKLYSVITPHTTEIKYIYICILHRIKKERQKSVLLEDENRRSATGG